MNPDKKDENEIVDMIDDDPLAEITVMDGGDGISYDVLPDDLFSFAQEMPAPEVLPSTPVAPPAQVMAPVAPAPRAQAVPPAKTTIEVSEDPEEFAETKVHKKTDDLLENALSNITVNDVIERLDTLVNLFRTREIPRQLAIIDLMMDQLNLSSFFPGLAEASSKSLESNQYALSRIEEVLSKLKGSIKNPKNKEIDLMGFQPPAETSADIQTENVRANLENQAVISKFKNIYDEHYKPLINQDEIVNNDYLTYVLSYEANNILTSIKNNIEMHYTHHLYKLAKIVFNYKEKLSLLDPKSDNYKENKKELYGIFKKFYLDIL